jgi:hypothetical protein
MKMEGNTIMSFMKLTTVLSAGALLSCVAWNGAFAQAAGAPWVQEGTTYTLHSKAIGECPAMDWHIVRGQNNMLTGLVSMNNMKTVFRVSGPISGANFHLDGSEVGGSRTGALNGQLQSDGRLAMTIGGLPVGAACQGKTVYIQFHPAYNYSGGNG